MRDHCHVPITARPDLVCKPAERGVRTVRPTTAWRSGTAPTPTMSTTTDGTTDDATATTTISLSDLTAFQRDCLYVIAGLGDPCGLEVKDELEDYYESEVLHGRLYPNLDDLVDAGLVEKSERDGRTNSYALTDAGETALQSRREWENEQAEQITE